MDGVEAANLAEKIVAIDESIYSVGIVSNSGQPLGGYTRPSFRNQNPNESKWDSGSFTKVWGTEAFRVAMIFGSASTGEKLLSRLELVVLVREKLKVILFTLIPRYPVIVGLVANKKTNDIELVEKIRSSMAQDA
jgi:hypothetical protein